AGHIEAFDDFSVEPKNFIERIGPRTPVFIPQLSPERLDRIQQNPFEHEIRLPEILAFQGSIDFLKLGRRHAIAHRSGTTVDLAGDGFRRETGYHEARHHPTLSIETNAHRMGSSSTSYRSFHFGRFPFSFSRESRFHRNLTH